MSNDKGGRPAIGPKVPINFSAGLLQDIEGAAATAGMSRAAWVRRAAARALPESFQGSVRPDQLGQFLRGSVMGEDLDNPDRDVHVDNETALRLLRAVDDGTLNCGSIRTTSVSVETEGSRCSLSFITRPFIADGQQIVIYQVTYTTVSGPLTGEAEGAYHHERTLYVDRAAAEVFHEHLLDAHFA